MFWLFELHKCDSIDNTHMQNPNLLSKNKMLDPDKRHMTLLKLMFNIKTIYKTSNYHSLLKDDVNIQRLK